MEQTQEVIVTQTRNNNDRNYVDITLRYQKRNRSPEPDVTTGVIFVQDVPAAAKTAYLLGVDDFAKQPEKGLEEVEAALKIFPDYFDALDWLGKEYISRKQYEKGYPYLLKAIDVNPRSASSFYSLGYAFYQMKQYPAALEAAKATTTLVPGSIDSQLLYGTVLRITGSYTEAETVLLKANSLAKKMNAQVHWQL
jgi:tetratricopeptide (TPR) repeat protein